MSTKRQRKQVTDWTATPEGHAKYQLARSQAQAAANADGFDRGLERNDLFRCYHVRMLPGRRYRAGSELRCEVVMCETLERCQPGHGPLA